MSLKCMIDKWLHKGQISQEEYDAVIKKLDGHDAEREKQIRAGMFEELKSLLRCRNYRGCASGKGCDGVCSIDSDICKSCENFGIPYSLLEQLKGAENE